MQYVTDPYENGLSGQEIMETLVMKNDRYDVERSVIVIRTEIAWFIDKAAKELDTEFCVLFRQRDFVKK